MKKLAKKTGFIIASVFVLLTGCTKQETSEHSATNHDSSQITNNTSQPATLTSSNGCFEFTTNLPLKAEANEYFDFSLDLNSHCVAEGKIEKIVFYADMPEHKHGMNTDPSVEKVGAKRYVVNGTLLHMPGYWVATFEFHYDGKIEISNLDINL